MLTFLSHKTREFPVSAYRIASDRFETFFSEHDFLLNGFHFGNSDILRYSVTLSLEICVPFAFISIVPDEIFFK